MENNNKKRVGKPKSAPELKRDRPFIVRLNSIEMDTIKAKCMEAGYQAIGPFIRDHLIAIKPKSKTSIPGANIHISQMIIRVAVMLDDGAPTESIIQELRKINNTILGI